MDCKRKSEYQKLFLILIVFFLFYYLPVGVKKFDNAVIEALRLVKWYVREHFLFCLIPAFFIAGAMRVFLNQDSVTQYFGVGSNKLLSFGVASVSGSIVTACSCTILPLFESIYRMGAGIGPAITLVYSGPAINILAVILTFKVLGVKLGIARAIGAIFFGIIIGVIMQTIFLKEEKGKVAAKVVMPERKNAKPIWQYVFYFMCIVGILVFANWKEPMEEVGVFMEIYEIKWLLTSGIVLALIVILLVWFDQEEISAWFFATWEAAKRFIPLLFLGILVAGFLFGHAEHKGLVPSAWVVESISGNSLLSNFIASFVGAFMYFATLVEIPILRGLMNNGMGQGPALALLLAGPAISLPNMLIIRSVIGTKKTVVFVGLVVVMATLSGMVFGSFFG